MTQHYGVCEWSFPVSGPLAIQLAAEAGYEGMQVGEAGGRPMGFPLNDPRVCAAYLESAAAHHVRLHSLNLGALLAEGTMNYAAGTREGNWARESLEHGFAAARALGVEDVVITVDAPDSGAEANAVEHLRYAQRLAADSGMVIAMESALPLPDILRILDKAGPEIKVCMDLLNPLRFGTGDPQEQIRAFGRERIRHFHWKDSQKDLFRKGERGCMPLGQGDAGLAASAALIRELGFRDTWMISENYYHLEPLSQLGGDLTARAARDLAAMQGFFADPQQQ
ncbi:MAG: sugar phosphate isomerase/epimerase [Clostridiales bacterium]|nr:sugar phosphate isomerase/epimerase [Clostridiales bacterium]